MPYAFRACSILVAVAVLLTASAATAQMISSGVPRFDAAVVQAVRYIKAHADDVNEVQRTLVSYALLKAGEPKDSPLVAAGLKTASDRALGNGYRGYDHIYLSGVDAMLLADTDPDQHFLALQSIADYVQSAQREDGSWSDTPGNPGDVSMSQYGVLALWAAKRSKCNVAPGAIDRAASWLLASGNNDGGWGYRPGTKAGPGQGASTHNMTLAAGGSLAIVRTLLAGPKGFRRQKKDESERLFGELEKVNPLEEESNDRGSAYPDYNPQNPTSTIDNRVDRAFSWNQTRFDPVSKAAHKIYFYYALERAAALNDLRDGWFETYGDGLLTLQGKDGEWNTHSGRMVGTSFAILYFMRSTQQILSKQFGGGGQRGNRDLLAFMNPDGTRKNKEIGPLDELLSALENQDFASLDVDATDVVEKIQFGSKEELVGQVDSLKTLLKHPEAETRQVAYWALGRTGDFSLVPLMLEGLRDVNVDVNVEALNALRYIARKPNGFGLSVDPLQGVDANATDEQRVATANAWRTRAYKAWGQWYSSVRPFSERDGLDELQLRLP